jgi:predicted peptidase
MSQGLTANYDYRLIMGLSLGSFGTWTTVNQFPGVYKKAVPMAGNIFVFL